MSPTAQAVQPIAPAGASVLGGERIELEPQEGGGAARSIDLQLDRPPLFRIADRLEPGPALLLDPRLDRRQVVEGDRTAPGSSSRAARPRASRRCHRSLHRPRRARRRPGPRRSRLPTPSRRCPAWASRAHAPRTAADRPVRLLGFPVPARFPSAGSDAGSGSGIVSTAVSWASAGDGSGTGGAARDQSRRTNSSDGSRGGELVDEQPTTLGSTASGRFIAGVGTTHGPEVAARGSRDRIERRGSRPAAKQTMDDHRLRASARSRAATSSSIGPSEVSPSVQWTTTGGADAGVFGDPAGEQAGACSSGLHGPGPRPRARSRPRRRGRPRPERVAGLASSSSGTRGGRVPSRVRIGRSRGLPSRLVE